MLADNTLDTDDTTPSRKRLSEALNLAGDLLKSIELSEGSLTAVMLRASRLARMLNEQDFQLAFEYEASGFPNTARGVNSKVWEIARLAGRVYEREDEDGVVSERATLEAVEVVEARISSSNAALSVVQATNTLARNQIRKSIIDDTKKLARSRGFVHRFVARKFDELRFSGIADDIFSRIRVVVDESIISSVPNSANKLTSIYENLSSDNPEDWANAVHGCRRVLQDLADVLFPPRDPIVKAIGSKEITIKLGPDNYINRLMAFIEEHSQSERFSAVVGSSLKFIGDRLDASFQAAQKGSHAEISTRMEADRYFVYTYMLVADILSLRERM